MSWNRHIFKSYNRQNIKEETHYWQELFNHDDDHFYWWYHWDGEDMFSWADLYQYDGDGKCYSMDEYHQMHLLTLLRSLNIKTAAEKTLERGW